MASQAPRSMGFFQQLRWSGLPYPPRGNLPNLGIEPESHVSPTLQVDSLLLSHQGSPILYTVVCICGEGNGKPLQYSCLGNPLDGGAW